MKWSTILEAYSEDNMKHSFCRNGGASKSIKVSVRFDQLNEMDARPAKNAERACFKTKLSPD
jgi:hypothetical protein